MPANIPSMSLPVKYLQITFFTFVILYFGRVLFIPLFLGLLIAIVMYPICKWLEAHKWNKSLAITACIVIVATIFALISLLFIWQLGVFSNYAPQVLESLETILVQLQEYASENMGLSIDLKNSWGQNLIGVIGSTLSSAVEATIGTVVILFLTPIYTVLFLYHRSVFVQFLTHITPIGYRNQLVTILQQTIETYFNFIKGMMLVYLLVGILNSLGLMVLGVRHAILFGMLCAIMTIIPYVGIIVSALLPISIVWIDTGNFWYPLGVVIIFGFIQYLEANVIFPKIVGAQLHVNTFAILVAFIAGGIVWGVSGMILFIPFVAIIKIISDNIDEWKSINVLLSRK
ncbi:MAG: AI-2E family transporter [Saprospiraceae bacterium]|nr:AI-2E family transporter [Saprospiraceae bacterium]